MRKQCTRQFFFNEENLPKSSSQQASSFYCLPGPFKKAETLIKALLLKKKGKKKNKFPEKKIKALSLICVRRGGNLSKTSLTLTK